MRVVRASVVAILGVVIASCAVLGCSSAQAAGGLDFTSVGTHPQAAAQSTSWGKEIGDMQFDAGGNIVVGYGDWNTNTGPIAVNPFSTTTNSFAGQQLSIPTEAVEVVRSINGKLYMPWTDPQGSWDTPTSGYSTNASGTWQNVGKVTAVHVFDMASLGGNDLWMVGSLETDDTGGSDIAEAVAWRSNDGGQTWSQAYTDPDNPPSSGNGFERYYWVRVLNGKVYMQADQVTPQPPMRIYDPATDSWSNGPTQELCTTYQTNRIEVFAGKILCATSNTFKSFDGTSISTVANYPGSGAINDLYVDGSTLYVVDSQGYVYSTKDLNSWKIVANVPADGSSYGSAQSVAVRDGRMYIGTSNSQILEATTLIDDSTEVMPSISKVTPATVTQNTGSQQVLIDGSNFIKGSSVTIAGKQLTNLSVTPAEISGVIDTTGLATGSYDVTVTQPDGKTTILSKAFTVSAYKAPMISGVSMTRDEQNRVVLHVRGTNLLGFLKASGLTSSAYAVGLSNNLVSVNGTKLPFCVEGDLKNIFTTSTEYYRADPPCYRLIQYTASTGQVQSLLTDTGFDVLMGANFNPSAAGKVQLVGGEASGLRIDASNVYRFNTVPPGGNPVTPSPPVDPKGLLDSSLADTGSPIIFWGILGAILLIFGMSVTFYRARYSPRIQFSKSHS